MNRTENSIQINGGPGSGNHNPGQGRGIGKPLKNLKNLLRQKEKN